MASKLITIVPPCYNEQLNVREIHRRVMAIAAGLLSIDSSICSLTILRKTLAGRLVFERRNVQN